MVVIGMIWLPESPRWLLTRERYEEGTAVIAALRGLEIDDKETQLQKQIIMDSIAASGYAGRKGTPLKAVFTGGKTQHFRRMMLGVSSQFMQQVASHLLKGQYLAFTKIVFTTVFPQTRGNMTNNGQIGRRLQCCDILFPHFVRAIDKADTQHLSSTWWRQHDRLFNLCYRVLVHH